MSKYWLIYIVLVVIGVMCGGVLFPQTAESELWWQVELTISVKGVYSYQSDLKGFSGDYSYIATVLGTLQEDEGDFIFVQANQQIKVLHWDETETNGNVENRFSVSGKIEPVVSLNYVFRGDTRVSFDFDIKKVKVPIDRSMTGFPVKKLIMPESAGDSSIKIDQKYARGIKSGSNNLAVTLSELYNQNQLDKELKWHWQGKNKSPSWHTGHNVTVTLKILKHQK